MRKLEEALRRCWLTICLLVVRLYFKLFYRVEVRGRENVPPRGGVLLASNHVSYYDPVLIPSVLMSLRRPEIIHGPAKAELYRIPIFRQMLYSWGIYPVNRNGRDLKAMKKTIELLRTTKVMLFPEGERSIDGKLKEGKRFVGWMVLEAKPVVIPTAIIGTEKALPRGKAFPRFFTKIRIIFGPPLDLTPFYARERSKETAARITDRIMEGIARLLEEEGGSPNG